MVLIPNTNIVVDGFKYSSDPNRPEYTYFLTHMHSDHYCGLSEEWDGTAIYCSPLTKVLLLRKFPNLTCVHSLEMDEQHWISLKSDHSEGVSVTLIDANHCPGAVMLLFQGAMGTILHTGDFRFRPEMLIHPALQHAGEGLIDIDLLFLDNTYCHPKYTFPEQKTAIEKIKEIIEEEKGSEIELGTNLLGKEEVMIALSQHFQVPVHVSEEKFSELESLGLPTVHFTPNPNLSWLHQVDRSALKHIPEKIREGKRVIGLKLSGWCQQEKLRPWLYVLCIQAVPYSLHSNYPELVEFVEALKPKNIVFSVAESANSGEAAEFLRKYSYKAPMKKGKSAFPNVLAGSLKRKLPISQQIPAKKPKILGSRICN